MRPVFIASIGNPGSEYAHTLHSAGHTLLAALVSYLNFQPLSISRTTSGTKGRCSYSDQQGIAFWESPTYMNESGPTLNSAWKHWINSPAVKALVTAPDDVTNIVAATSPGDAMPRKNPVLLPRLIVLHDELELPIGKFTVKTGAGQSARGHNGLKSILASPGMNTVRFTRVGVGIGPRPESREPDVVARYVLWKMTRTQRITIETLGERIWQDIEKIREKGDVEEMKSTTGQKKGKSPTKT